MSNLQQRIAALRVNGLHGYFIPQKLLDNLLTESEIMKELRRQEHPPESLSESSSILASKGCKVFAILVEIGYVNQVANLIARGLLDGRLPLGEEDLSQHLDSGVMNRFLKFQWDYLAPIWGDGSSSHKILVPQTILPYTKEQFLSEGGFGMVFKVTLENTHQAFIENAPGPNIQVIRKEFKNNWIKDASSGASYTIEKDRTFQGFQNETRVLRLLRHSQNPHIVDILGSYVFRGVYNMIFPPADMDLEDLLGGAQNELFKHRSTLFEQLCGLASALHDMHSYRLQEQELELLGCHHDLKPNNILIFGQTWTLADFGLSRLTPASQGSKTIFKDCIGDYFAPECLDSEWSQQKIGRASDIWSFGCIISEVMTFGVLGSKGITKFRSRRKTEVRPRYFTSWFHSEGKMKVEVDAWLSHLERSVKDGAGKALVALSREMLHEHPHHRPNINSVQLHLTSIVLTSLAKPITDLLTDLTRYYGKLDLQIENLRFKEWCGGLGLVSSSSSSATQMAGDLMVVYPEMRRILRAMYALLSKLCLLDHEAPQNHLESVQDFHLKLRDYNDQLWTNIPPKLKEDMHAHWRNRRLQTEKEEELDLLEKNADNEVAGLARMRRLMLLMQQNKSDGEHGKLEANDIFDFRSFGEHATAGFMRFSSGEDGEEVAERHNVLIEWWSIQSWKSSKDDEQFVRISAIAALPNVPDRPSSFRVLESEGFFWDKSNSRFGIVYATPRLAFNASSIPPVTLRTVIEQNQSVSRLDRPLLGDRFALAYNLCLCVYEFHAVGWLHHKLSIDNVIFFPRPDLKVTATETLRNPYIIGFNHSRPFENSNCSITPTSMELENIHQHPEYRASNLNKNTDMESRFTRAFDYYSLGVILLQIGRWHNQEPGESGKTRGSDRWEQHEELLRVAQGLGAYMGEVYRDVVLYCLKGLRQEEIEAEVRAKCAEQEHANAQDSFDQTDEISRIDGLFQMKVLGQLSKYYV